MRLAPSETIGNYRLIRLIGQGGMGEVYGAEHIALRLPCALKVFTADGAKKEFLRKRFLAEGRLLARLDHPRLVKVRDLTVDETSGVPYFAMDLVLDEDGEPCTLEDWRKRRKPDEESIASVYADLREGLEYLHGQGVVHRDLKLENVLIGHDGRAVLSDFGVSRIFDEGLRRALSVTATFAADKAPIMGSFGYLAPELKRGEQATPASDAYALGVLIFRLLTGVWYENDSAAMDLLAGFDERWTTLLSQLLAEDPSKRLPLPNLNRHKVSDANTAKRPCRRDAGWPVRTVAASATSAGQRDVRYHASRRGGDGTEGLCSKLAEFGSDTRRMFWLVVVAFLLLALFGIALYFVSRPPHYDFDEFFPPNEEVLR